jgi:hypothetical protein
MPMGLPANAIRHLTCVDLPVRKVQRLRAQRAARRAHHPEGEGLFKKTEITRQTQMEPAREGRATARSDGRDRRSHSLIANRLQRSVSYSITPHLELALGTAKITKANIEPRVAGDCPD